MHVASGTTASEDIRERLLQTVEKLGHEVGEEGLTMGQIAACAGLGPGVVRRHFEGKEALLREVRRRFERELAQAMAKAQVGIVDAHARLYRMCTTYVDVARRDGWRYALAIGEYERGAHALTIPIARSFADQATACLADDRDPAGLALRIWIAIHGLVTTLANHDRHPPGDEERRYVDRYVRMTLTCSGAETLDRL